MCPFIPDTSSYMVNSLILFTIKDGNGELTKEEFLRGAREDQSVIDVLSLYQRDEIAQ